MAAPPSQVPQQRPPSSPQPVQMRVEPRTVPPSPEPGPIEPSRPPGKKGPSKALLTLLAIIAAALLAALTVLFIQEDLTGAETAILSGVGFAIALLGVVGIRWGWWVMAGVTAAFFGLNMYNLLNPEGGIFDYYAGSSYTFAVLLPGVGVLAGAAMQALYRVVGGK